MKRNIGIKCKRKEWKKRKVGIVVQVGEDIAIQHPITKKKQEKDKMYPNFDSKFSFLTSAFSLCKSPFAL